MRVFSLVLALVAATAGAEEPEVLNASPGAIATDMIGDANAEGVFEVVGAEHQEVVRHVQSGLVCRMDADDANRLSLAPGAVRGDDVSCEMAHAGTVITLSATRAARTATLRREIASASDALSRDHPDARRFRVTPHAIVAGLPRNVSAYYLATDAAGAQRFTRISVALVRGWVIKMRYTTPAANNAAAQTAALASDSAWGEAMADLPAH